MDFINNFLTLKIVLAPIMAFLVSFYSMPIIIKVAVKKELVAKPNHRTSHKGRVPNIGGVAIFLGFVYSVLVSANFNFYPNIQYVLLGLIFIFFIGLQDDILIISPRKKLFGEIVATLAMVVLGNVRFTSLHDFLGIGELNYIVSILLTVFVVIVIINSLNLIDGIDGLASGVGMLATLFYGIYFLLLDDKQATQLAIISFCAFGAMVPFFIYNVFGTRNKVFMGDAGALGLGFMLAFLTIEFCEMNVSTNNIVNVNTIFPENVAPIISICVLILPLFDTLRVFIIRLSQGKSPFRPDKNHLHHNMLALGFKHKQATTIMLAFNAIFIIIGILGRNLPGWLLLTIVIAFALALSIFIQLKIKAKNN